MRKILLVLLAAIALPFAAFAVPAAPYPVEMTLEDGTTIMVVQHGDEFGSYFADAQGRKYRRLDNGRIEQMSSEVSDMAIRKAQARREAAPVRRVGGFPTKGTPKSLVILVNFTDVKFVTPNPQEAFTRLLNESGYSDNNAIGSARDFFIASSDSAFFPQFDVYGPIELDHDMAYYGAHSGNDHDKNAHQMIVDACNKLSASGQVNFANYDYDGNKQLDNVFVYYAGHNEAEGGPATSVWPHQSNLSPYAITIDGVRLGNYACTSELRGSRGSEMCGIGTFCHEFGHVIGLPDMYNTDNSKAYTLGEWDIMCSGSYNGNGRTPIAYSAYERFYLGWLTPVQLFEAGQYSLEPLETMVKDPDKPYAYLIAAQTHNMSATNPTPSEFFLIENRQHVGWDSRSTTLPGTGMLVWHIDYNAGAWSSNKLNNYSPLRLHLEAAHGKTQSSSTAADPFPGSGNVHQCIPTLHNGTTLEPLLNIQVAGNDILFTYKNDGVNRLMLFPEQLDLFESTYCATTSPKTYTPAQTVHVQGVSLNPATGLTISTKSGFQVSTDSARWSTSASLTVNADSTISQTVFVRYNPNKQICETTSGSFTAQQGTNMKTLPLAGVSVRPTLITTPVLTVQNRLTPYSCHIEWEPQLDAENYYLTLYQLLDNQNNIVQGFEKFTAQSDIIAQGWESTTTATTTMAKDEGKRALLLNSSTDEVISETYVQPISNLSLWYSALSTEDPCNVGVITIEGQQKDAEEWTLVDSIFIKSTAKKQTFSKAIPYEDGMVRFRITYYRYGGNGVAIDSWTATCDKEIQYIYRGTDMTFKAYNENGKTEKERLEYARRFTRFDFGNLEPNTTYYYYLQAQENKGCEEKITPIAEPYQFTTLEGESADSRHMTFGIDSITYVPSQHMVYISNVEEGDNLYIYDSYGQIVFSRRLYDGENAIAIPVERFTPNTVYVIKHAPGRLKRKDKWVKFLAY